MRRIMRLSVLVVVLMVAFLIVGSVPVLADSTYVVQRGDTLYSIGRRFGVSVWEIARVNGIADVNRIWVGQRLRIPGGGGGHTPPPGPTYSYYPTAICVDGTISYAGYGWNVCCGHGGVRLWVPRRMW